MTLEYNEAVDLWMQGLLPELFEEPHRNEETEPGEMPEMEESK